MPSRSDRMWMAAYVVVIALLASSDLVGPVNEVLAQLIRFRGLFILLICVIAVIHTFACWRVDMPVEEVDDLRQKHERQKVEK